MKQSNIHEYEITDIKAHINSPAAKALITLYKYKPTQKKIEETIASYAESDRINVYGCVIKGKTAGMIVIKRLSLTDAEIIGIATSPEYRNLGLGREMIEYVIKNYRIKTITAETDDDAVSFYRKCGFSIINLGYKYKNAKRYKCVLNIK